MSKPIIILDEAEDELVAAQRWYENRVLGLGRDFRLAIDDAMDQLATEQQVASPVLNVSTALDAKQLSSNDFPIP